jgi:hypothetical protein
MAVGLARDRGGHRVNDAMGTRVVAREEGLAVTGEMRKRRESNSASGTAPSA